MNNHESTNKGDSKNCIEVRSESWGVCISHSTSSTGGSNATSYGQGYSYGTSHGPAIVKIQQPPSTYDGEVNSDEN